MLGTLIAIAATTVPAASAAADRSTKEPANIRAGGEQVSIVVNGHGAVTPQAAQRLHDEASEPSAEQDNVRTMEVPADAFNVSASVYKVQDQYGQWVNMTGHWNFRDDYVNGSDPRDGSGIAAEVPDCWVNDGNGSLRTTIRATGMTAT